MKNIEGYMLAAIPLIVHAAVKAEWRAMYKLALETSKFSHVNTYSQGIDKEMLYKRLAMGVNEVNRSMEQKI